jgi:uncharacterized protein (TIGR01777 family)
VRILASGSSGLIGRAFTARARALGHDVTRLVRHAPAGADEVRWDPAAGAPEPRAIEGFDAVVSLSGAGIGDARWSAARRALLRASRVRTTANLAVALAQLARPPRVLVSASAVGWYGDRGDEWLEEDAVPGEGFLAALAREWEAAAAPASAAGIRVVHPRSGIVLARRGGALGRLLPNFRAGLGGPLGNGRQWWSWIALEDMVAALLHAIASDAMRGPFNAASPQPETCAAFARTLGRVLGRPALLPAPAFALRLVLGRSFADEVLLASQRARPAALARSGFSFGSPDLEGALRSVLAA